MTSVCVTQPTLWPHVHLLARALSVDDLILLTSAQFSRRTKVGDNTFSTRQNSCRIVSPNGPLALVVPIRGSDRKPIIETIVANDGWQVRHLRSIELALGRAPYFDEIYPDVERILQAAAEVPNLGSLTSATWTWALGRLSGREDSFPLNRQICELETARISPLRHIFHDTDLCYDRTGDGSDWMLQLAKARQADVYVAGATAAEQYLDREAFAAAGIRVEVHRALFEPWPQRAKVDSFESDVSILDLAANVGWDQARERLLHSLT